MAAFSCNFLPINFLSQQCAVHYSTVTVVCRSSPQRSLKSFSIALIPVRLISLVRNSQPRRQSIMASAVTTTATTTTTAELNLFHLKNHKAHPHYVDHVNLDFELDDQGLDTLVSAELSIRPDCPAGTPLTLDGECVELIGGSLAIDGSPIPEDKYTSDSKDGKLIISNVPDVPFKLTTQVRIKPLKNTELSGLYMSDGLFVTQCESMGFRRITYFPDRPDVVATYKVRITANKDEFPVLLSNGNCMDSGDVVGDSGRH